MANRPTLIHLLHRASQVAKNCRTRRLGDADVTPRQLAVLAAIGAHEGASLVNIVEATGVDRSKVADMVRRLLKRGLVSRKRTKEDARAYPAQLDERDARGRHLSSSTASRTRIRLRYCAGVTA